MTVLDLMKNIETRYKDDPLAKVAVVSTKYGGVPIASFLSKEVQEVDVTGALIGEPVALRGLPVTAQFVMTTLTGHYSVHNKYTSVVGYLMDYRIDVQTYPSQDHKDHKATIAPVESEDNDGDDDDDDGGDPD